MRTGESHANADRDSDGYAHTDSYAYSHSNSYPYADSYANGDSNSNSYTDSYANCYTYADQDYPDAASAADAAAASVGPILKPALP